MGRGVEGRLLRFRLLLLFGRGRGRRRLVSPLAAEKAAKALLLLLDAASVVALPAAATARVGGFAALLFFFFDDAPAKVRRDPGGALSSRGDKVDRGEMRQRLPLAPEVFDD